MLKRQLKCFTPLWFFFLRGIFLSKHHIDMMISNSSGHAGFSGQHPFALPLWPPVYCGPRPQGSVRGINTCNRHLRGENEETYSVIFTERLPRARRERQERAGGGEGRAAIGNGGEERPTGGFSRKRCSASAPNPLPQRRRRPRQRNWSQPTSFPLTPPAWACNRHPLPSLEKTKPLRPLPAQVTPPPPAPQHPLLSPRARGGGPGMAVTQAETPLQIGPARWPRGEPARPQSEKPGLTLPSAGDIRNRKTMAEHIAAAGDAAGVLRGFFYLRESWRSSPFCRKRTTPRRNWRGPATSATSGRPRAQCASAAVCRAASSEAPAPCASAVPAASTGQSVGRSLLSPAHPVMDGAVSE